MGLEAFREFIRQLDATSAGQHQQTSSPRRRTPKTTTSSTGRCYGAPAADPRRTLLERRLEAAAALADPFALRLEADGVLSVRVLARVPARAWGLPSCLLEEIERMLGLLAARACASDHFHAHRGGQVTSRKSPDAAEKPKGSKGGRRFCADEMRAGGKLSCRSKRGRAARKNRQMFAFDPRFQRSPTDPFGRPPRLERIQPCLGPRQEAHGDPLPDDEDDLPPGVWDPPDGSGTSDAKNGGPDGDGQTGDAATKRAQRETGLPASFSAGVVDFLNDAESELAERVTGGHPQGAVVERKPQRQAHPRAALDAAHKSAGDTTTPISAKIPKSSSASASLSSRLTCRAARPHCRAAFSKASNLRLHESSHAAAPEYHRLGRAPQLGRDPAPALSEGAGAPAEKFRLRTTLPPSVRRELQQLQEEGERRRRESLLAGPGLSGTVATWAGVVSPGRATFGQSGGT